jgi:hypothetical protein
MEKRSSRFAHNEEITGSNPVSATNLIGLTRPKSITDKVMYFNSFGGIQVLMVYLNELNDSPIPIISRQGKEILRALVLKTWVITN